MNPDIKPGSFFEPEEDPYQSQDRREQPEQSRAFGPEVSDRLQDQLETFKTALNPDAEVIYYPCCQNDTTISQVFPNSRTIYADLNSAAITMLKEHKFEAVEADATTYEPDQQPNIVLLLNPAINPEKPASTVKEGGYLICNNYHNTANNLHSDENFEFIGAIVPKRDGQTILDT
ncbi:MAG: hypothetical protein HYZ51_02120 [Candidatus Doudnabacteria bacterium]|nr:hypothetical protein [Candidatus Doudnabacteria bacterium]